jgi:hypothetical protein
MQTTRSVSVVYSDHFCSLRGGPIDLLRAVPPDAPRTSAAAMAVKKAPPSERKRDQPSPVWFSPVWQPLVTRGGTIPCGVKPFGPTHDRLSTERVPSTAPRRGRVGRGVLPQLYLYHPTFFRTRFIPTQAHLQCVRTCAIVLKFRTPTHQSVLQYLARRLWSISVGQLCCCGDPFGAS